MKDSKTSTVVCTPKNLTASPRFSPRCHRIKIPGHPFSEVLGQSGDCVEVHGWCGAGLEGSCVHERAWCNGPKNAPVRLR
jgi:hypothetical protein